MIRYNCISTLPNVMSLIDYSIPEVNFDDSLADFSCFVPTSESVRTLKVGNVNHSGMFDFPDGKDSGMNVPVSRQKGVDISQISTDLRLQQEKVSKALKDAQDFQALKDSLQKKVVSDNLTDKSTD